MKTRGLGLITSASIGIAAAVATTAIMDDRFEKQSSAQPSVADETASSRPLQPVKIITRTGENERIAAIEDELQRLRTQREPSLPGADGQPELPQLTTEEQEAEMRQIFSELDQSFRDDVVDSSWSQSATVSLAQALAGWGQEFGFVVESAECKTKLCRTTVTWDDYEQASRTGRFLAERIIPGLNCAQSIWLRQPESPNQAYTADLYLDCSDLRAGLVSAGEAESS